MKQNILKKQAAKIVVYLGKKKEQRNFCRAPLIIGACPRSGTTLLLSILGAHNHIFAIPTQTYAFDLWQKNVLTSSPAYIPERPERFYGYLLLNKVPQSARRWCEKTPRNIQSFDKILDYFGNYVQLINVFRDGRDVVTSKHPRHSPDKYWVPIERWINDVKIGLNYQDHPQVLNVRYEDLVQSFEETIHKIYDFIKEPIPENPTSWIEKTNIKESKHWGGTVQEIYSKSIGRWKDEKHQQRIQEFMANREAVELLQKLNYPVSLTKSGK